MHARRRAIVPHIQLDWHDWTVFRKFRTTSLGLNPWVSLTRLEAEAVGLGVCIYVSGAHALSQKYRQQWEKPDKKQVMVGG